MEKTSQFSLAVPDGDRTAERLFDHITDTFQAGSSVRIEMRPPSSTTCTESQERVRYVEVPVVEEVVKYVPKKEFVEVEKFVPKMEVKYVDRTVEVPRVEYVEKTREVDVVKKVPRKRVVDVPRDVVREVPRVEVRVTENAIYVPGKVVEVPKPVVVDRPVERPVYEDTDVPTIVSKTVSPILSESKSAIFEPEVAVYEPYVVPVDIYIPRGVQMDLIDLGRHDEDFSPVPLGSAEFNSLLLKMNPHVNRDACELPFRKDEAGLIRFADTPDIEPIEATAAALASIAEY